MQVYKIQLQQNAKWNGTSGPPYFIMLVKEKGSGHNYHLLLDITIVAYY